jgi:ABC-2 type transport system permease protein
LDRLIALVALRVRLDLRAATGSRARMAGLLVAVPGLLFVSAFQAVLAFVGVRFLEAHAPEMLVPALSAVATVAGALFVLSPLLAGVAFAEAHDLTRLLHFPVPLPILVTSSLLANLLQPTVLGQAPLALVLALSLAIRPSRIPICLLFVGLAFLFLLAAAQVTGLLLHGISRNRRLHDRLLFLGLGVGFMLSLLPILLLTGGGGSLGFVFSWVVDRDLLVLSPFAWGLRAAAHAGQGEMPEAFAFAALAVLALLAAVSLSTVLVSRIYRGELDLGGAAPQASSAPAAMRLPGALGALLEKDLRVTWRDPRLKALLFTGLAGPLLLLLFWKSTGGTVGARVLLVMASLAGLSTLGSNSFALEGRGLGLLVGFPIERWKVLVAKNLGAIALRLPSLLLLSAAALFVASWPVVPAILVIALSGMLIACAADNFMSILFPVTVPAAGRNPYGPTSGTRGLGAAAFAALLMFAALAVSAPFAFLAWLPLLLRQRWLWSVSLPLALAGAIAVYAMLVAWAEGLLRRREPELVARMLAEE